MAVFAERHPERPYVTAQVKRRRGRPVGWRKPGRKSETIMVRLSPVMVTWLLAQSEEHGLSMSALVRQAIERSMEQDS